MTQEALTSAPEARQRPVRWVTGRRARVLLCASGVSFMIMLDSNIVAVSLPSIARDLNATFADIEWVVSAYVLTFAALLMPSGALADRYGRRLMLTVGLAVFVLASLLCGLAPSAPWFSMRRERCRASALRSSLARRWRCSATNSRARNAPRRSASGERSSASLSPLVRLSAA